MKESIALILDSMIHKYGNTTSFLIRIWEAANEISLIQETVNQGRYVLPQSKATSEIDLVYRLQNSLSKPVFVLFA